MVIVLTVLSYRVSVMIAPKMIADSRAMKTVPAPTPLRSSGERSAVQAKMVGLEIPVDIPKTIAPIVN